MQIVSKQDFQNLSPFGKGYAVTAFGSNEKEPHVPADYKPCPENKADFLRGKLDAELDAVELER